MTDAISRSAYREEIEAALNTDQKMIGDVFRLTSEGMDPQFISNELHIRERRIRSRMDEIQTLVECQVLTDIPTEAARRASRVRGFSKRHARRFSEQTRKMLEALADDHERVAKDEDETDRCPGRRLLE